MLPQTELGLNSDSVDSSYVILGKPLNIPKLPFSPFQIEDKDIDFV